MIPPDPHAPPPPVQDHILSNHLYDYLKLLAQIVLPAFGTLYFTLAGLWGLPAADQVVGTIVAIDTFLGVLLHISTKSFDKSEAKFDGSIDVMYLPEGKKTYSLNLDREPGEIERSDQITFKVNPPIL